MTKHPNSEQIQKYLEHVSSLAAFQWIHLGNQEPIPDLVAVTEWLESLVDNKDAQTP